MVGGISIFVGFYLSAYLLGSGFTDITALLVSSALVLLIGVLDDRFDISSLFRFVVQTVAALLMIRVGGVHLETLGQLVASKELYLGAYGTVVTVLATVGVINALNMSDGMDGMGGGLFLIVFSAIAIVLFCASEVAAYDTLLVLIVCVFAFLLFNVRLGIRKAATVFLGDAGSMFLGFVAAWFLIKYSQKPYELLDPVTALWFVAIPLADTIAVMTRRMALGRSPFGADRTHFHHLLLHKGLSVNAAFLLLMGIGVSLAVAGAWLEAIGMAEYHRFYIAMGITAVHHLVTTMYVIRHGLLSQPQSAPSPQI